MPRAVGDTGRKNEQTMRSFRRLLGGSVGLLAGSWLATSTAVAAQPSDDALARWQSEAQATTIVRDQWGIAHVHGRSDADAVFGMLYAQAEDDFNRVETNFLNAMGRLAEAEGESALFQDLRMKLFIRPEELQALYRGSPAWLQKLMNAWADFLDQPTQAGVVVPLKNAA